MFSHSLSAEVADMVTVPNRTPPSGDPGSGGESGGPDTIDPRIMRRLPILVASQLPHMYDLLSTPVWIFSIADNHVLWCNAAAREISRTFCGFPSMESMQQYTLSNGVHAHMLSIVSRLSRQVLTSSSSTHSVAGSPPTQVHGSYAAAASAADSAARNMAALLPHSANRTHDSWYLPSIVPNEHFRLKISAAISLARIGMSTAADDDCDAVLIIEAQQDLYEHLDSVMTRVGNLRELDEEKLEEALSVQTSEDSYVPPPDQLADLIDVPVGVFRLSDSQLVLSNSSFKEIFGQEVRFFADCVDKDHKGQGRLFWRRATSQFQCGVSDHENSTDNEYLVIGNRTFSYTAQLWCRCETMEGTAQKVGGGLQRLHENDCVIMTFHDETQRVKSDAEAMYAKDLIRICNHELRHPLLANHLIVAMLLQETDLTEFQREHLQLVESNIDVNLRLVNSILVSARAESGKLQLDCANFNLHQVVRNTCLTVSKAHLEKADRVQSIVTIDTGVPEIVYADALKIRELVTNIASNAYKFTNAGYIEVNVSCLERKPDDVLLKFEVRDTGCGLDPNEKDRLFVEQFVQFSRKDHELGSGLGLHISKMLAEMMDGEIGVRDNQQAAVSGSVFWFTIHVKPPQYTVPDLSRASVTRPRSSSFTGRLPQKRASVMFSTPLTEEQAGVTVGSSSMVGMYSNSANATPALIERNTPVGFEQNSRRGSTNSRTSICVSSSGSLSSNLSIPLIGDMDKFLTHTDLPPDFLAMRRRSCLPRIPLATSSSHARNEGYPKGTVRPTSSSSGNKKDKGPERRLSVSADRAKTIPSMRILLVDDDPIVARVQSKQLSKSGHHVTVCASGTAALSTLTATEQPFDVCLLDLYMPVMDGVETVHLIRELDNANAQMLVLGCTSSSDAQDLQRCIAAGMDAVIDKAFRVGEFEEAYMRLIHHEGPARRNNAPTSAGASRSPNRSPSNNRQSSTSQSSVTNAS